MRLPEFLDAHDVAYEVIAHRNTYDAQRMAAEIHVSGRNVVKSVLLRADNGYVYVVALLPANRQLDLAAVSAGLGGSRIELASEEDVSKHCPDCELGTLPPFGSQYGMKTIADESLLKLGQIVFEGSRHNESIRMRFEDFRRIEEPLVARITAAPRRPNRQKLTIPRMHRRIDSARIG